MQRAQRAQRPLAFARRTGTTLIEMMVVMSVMLVAVSIFYQMMLATARLRTINHENAIAIEGARAVVEAMRNEDFREVFALYNLESDDDPGGKGTAPGGRFNVEGLEPLPGGGGLVGEIIFPAVLVEAAGGGGGGGAGLKGVGGLGVGGGGAAADEWQLREDFVDESLGMPRDLNGDSIVDDEDHALDYILMPIQIRVEWQGPFGPRQFDLYTMLGEFRT